MSGRQNTHTEGDELRDHVRKEVRFERLSRARRDSEAHAGEEGS